MSGDLTGRQDNIPERFAPGEMQGQLAAAEHLGRYRWAASAAGGKRVLDAGCGTAYGTAMLAAAGATAVTGVDVAESVLESVRGEMPPQVKLEVADLSKLPYADASFDLVVCFEVIEHLEDPFPALDELARVLAPDGVLLISSPNRGVYPPGNPHHHHEFQPQELEAELHKRLRNVRLMHQHAYVTAAILDDAHHVSSSEQPLEGVPLYKLADDKPDRELYTLAVAGDGELPPVPPLAILTSRVALDEWIAHIGTYEETLSEYRARIADLYGQLEDRRTLLVDLRNGEEQLAEALRAVEHREAAAQAIVRSLSWRVTKPLRGFKVLLGRRRRG
jgi:SAM-dependent methyltransferase